MDKNWVTEPPDVESREIREVYALAGLALYCAQCLEHEIVNALGVAATIEALRKKRETAFEKFTGIEDHIDRIWDEGFRKTLGALIKSLRESGLRILPEIEDDLNCSLDARNRLVHRYFREMAHIFLTPAGRRAIAEELTVMQELFGRTDRALHELSRASREAYGVTDDKVDKYIELIHEGLTPEQALDVAFPLPTKR